MDRSFDFFRFRDFERQFRHSICPVDSLLNHVLPEGNPRGGGSFLSANVFLPPESRGDETVAETLSGLYPGAARIS